MHIIILSTLSHSTPVEISGITITPLIAKLEFQNGTGKTKALASWTRKNHFDVKCKGMETKHNTLPYLQASEQTCEARSNSDTLQMHSGAYASKQNLVCYTLQFICDQLSTSIKKKFILHGMSWYQCQLPNSSWSCENSKTLLHWVWNRLQCIHFLFKFLAIPSS